MQDSTNSRPQFSTFCFLFLTRFGLSTSDFRLIPGSPLQASRFKLFSCFLLLASSFLLPSCSFNPNYQGKGSDFIQGKWKQDSVERQKQLVSYSLYNFHFSCDSFYLQVNSVSKVNYGSDTCMNKGHWQEYAKGTYEQHTDTLRLSGFFCNADYSLKKENGCFRFGAYEESFKIGSKTDSVINLISLTNPLPMKLKLVKRMACVPKAL